jgi:putative MATE family efflux protein
VANDELVVNCSYLSKGIMKDFTKGSIWRHVISIAAFIGAGFFVQTLYLLVDLYFVGGLGKPAVAGVASAATFALVATATSQLVSVGGLSLISQAIGREDKCFARTILQQNLTLSVLMAIAFLVVSYGVGLSAVSAVAADGATSSEAKRYLFSFLPCLATMFPGSALGAALRSVGAAMAQTLIQISTVLLNVILAPVLISGWFTNMPLGVLGAGIASSIASVFGLLTVIVLFNSIQKVFKIGCTTHLDFSIWKRIVGIGVPTAGEYAFIFVITASAYWSLRHFGSQAQAGYGIGSRIIQALFLPSMAVAFASGPIAGQNYGARISSRVRHTFYHALSLNIGFALILFLICQLAPEALVLPFSSDPSIRAIAASLVRISSVGFVATGLSFCCSGIFQALGNTWPSLISSGSRLFTYVIPAVWMASQGWAPIHYFWYLSVFSVSIQAIISLAFIRREFRLKLSGV